MDYVTHLLLPYIAMDWDKEKEYDKSDIVRFRGYYYAAITHVPVGINLNDENYWLMCM